MLRTHSIIASPMMFREGLCQAFPGAWIVVLNVDGCRRGPGGLPVFTTPRWVTSGVSVFRRRCLRNSIVVVGVFLLIPCVCLPPLTDIVLCPGGAGTVTMPARVSASCRPLHRSHSWRRPTTAIHWCHLAPRRSGPFAAMGPCWMRKVCPKPGAWLPFFLGRGLGHCGCV